MPELHFLLETVGARKVLLVETLKSCLERGALKSGDDLVLRRRDGRVRTAKVNPDGTITTDDGKVHRSPSGAAKHCVGRSIDGWTAWRLSDGRTLDSFRQKRTDPKGE
jgi:hypothetical protein